MFAATGIVAGSINNLIGPRYTLFLGTFGYAIYLSALWVYQTRHVQWYLIFAGAIQGIGAALLWAAQGSIMMAYPSESEKGRAFSLFWMIFNSGALIGGLIALGINIAQGAISATATSTYIAFFVIIMCGVCLSLTILPPARVIRADGSIVKSHSYATPREEIKGLWLAIRQKEILLLLCSFFASNFFYTYQQAFAFALFDAQARSLNGVIKSIGQIIGAVIIGFVLDKMPFSRRRNRGLAGIALTALFIIVAWSWGLRYQLSFNRKTKIKKMHWNNSSFGEPIAILVLYDLGDAMFQGVAYWTMGALTNDPFRLARYAGLYKAVQSAGAAVAFGIDAAKVEYLNELLAAWLLLLVSMPLMAVVVWKVKDTEGAEAGSVRAVSHQADAEGQNVNIDEKDEEKVAHDHIDEVGHGLQKL